MQAGWRYSNWEIGPDQPRQYWEYCRHCKGLEIDRRLIDDWNQNWGTTIDYWVQWDGNRRWCAVSEFTVRWCEPDLLDAPAELQVMSEVHVSMFNPLDTIFNEVRYKDPADGVFKRFYQYNYLEEYPYGLDIYQAYHWRSYRKHNPNGLYLPVVYK